MFDHDLLADLPAPGDDEPPSLRADIADELADHLRCAFRREVFKDGDEIAAEQRVLDRFGDPQKLARRLWWQAMRSMIMGQRILSGLQWLVSLSAVALAGAVFWQQSQMWQEMRAARQEEAAQRQALTTALNQLQTQKQAASVPAITYADVPVHEIADENLPNAALPIGAADVPVRIAEESPSDAGLSMDRGPDAVSFGPPPAVEAADTESPPALSAKMDPGPHGVNFTSPPPVVAPVAESSPVLTAKFVLEKADGPAVSPKRV